MNQPFNIGVALAGGGGKRRKDDFYATPWEATVALHIAIGHLLPEKIWEPSCGDGAMASVLEMLGHTVIASDLVDRGYGHAPLNFLDVEEMPGCKAIVTNPPFALAQQFIEHSGRLAPITAFLLKANYWHAKSRLPLFREDPPSHILPLTWRIDFTGQERPTMDCSWYVWGLGDRLVYEPLPKPKPDQHPMFK